MAQMSMNASFNEGDMSACAANPASICASTQAVLRSHAGHLLPVDMLHTSCCPLTCACQVKILVVAGDHRIGIYANRSIDIGEE